MFQDGSTLAPSVNPHSTGFEVDGVSLDELFPAVQSNLVPFGARVVVQMRRVVDTYKGLIALPKEARETEEWNVQVGKIVALGPLAFRDRKSGDDWPEGRWAKEGDFVIAPKYGGFRHSVNDASGKPVVLLVLGDHELIAKVDDPRAMRAHIT